MESSGTVVGVDIAKRVFQLHWVETETGGLVGLRPSDVSRSGTARTWPAGGSHPGCRGAERDRRGGHDGRSGNVPVQTGIRGLARSRALAHGHRWASTRARYLEAWGHPSSNAADSRRPFHAGAREALLCMGDSVGGGRVRGDGAGGSRSARPAMARAFADALAGCRARNSFEIFRYSPAAFLLFGRLQE